jgi:polysaccharide deacetylase family protein (PEP-CTERM system associated)
MSPASGNQSYQRASGLTRATERSARRFAPLPAEFTFTVDVEEHAGGARAAAQTARLLDLLEAADARGTFFVLDAVAANDPALVRLIAARGHEVASHGHDHRRLADARPGEFRAGMAAARDRLADLLGAPPAGYRAPYFSLTPQAAWVPEALAALGFAYSSSVLPAWNPMAGWPGAPRRPFLWPSGLLELPVPVARLGPFRLPFLGGMYLRWLPPWRIRQFARRWAREEAAGGTLWSYCHPYDLDETEGLVRRGDAGAFGSLMLWLNRGPTLPRLQGLLRGRRSEPFVARLPALRAAATPWAPGGAPLPALAPG